MENLLKIRRGERLAAALAAVALLALNCLTFIRYWDLYLNTAHCDLWKRFVGNFDVSGYDAITYVEMTYWGIMHEPYRHPLYALFVWPFWLINRGLIALTGMNCAMFVMAAVLTACGVYSFLFLSRILRRSVGLTGPVVWLLSGMLFSFGHVMVAQIVPDHFAISQCLLLATLCSASEATAEQRPISAWRSALLFLLTAGVSTTNGVKTLIVDLMASGRRFFAPKRLALVCILPAAILASSFYLQETYSRAPQREAKAKAVAQKAATDSVFAKRARWQEKKKQKAKSRQIASSKYFAWTDTGISRPLTLWHNVFGEPVQLHDDHLLVDGNCGRPLFAAYNYWINYVVEVLLICMLLFGAWTARRERLMQMALACFAVDMLLHVALSFAITEVYLMSAHWLFVLPLSAAYTIKRAKARWRKPAVAATAVLTLWLAAWNACLLASYMVS